MGTVPMRFDGYEWHHNPKEINFFVEKNVSEQSAPFEYSSIQTTGRKNMVISGIGELYGEDCMQQFSNLLKLFLEHTKGILALYKFNPIFAVFENLKIIGEPKPNILTYSFVFREVMQNKKENNKKFHIVKNGENLWDISYAYNISIDTLVRLNPQVKRPDELVAKSKVILC